MGREITTMNSTESSQIDAENREGVEVFDRITVELDNE
jgi:hypothetical protein